MSKYKIGDIVKLKSGGPDMTVKQQGEGMNEEIFVCQWFAGKKLERGAFPSESLESVKKTDN